MFVPVGLPTGLLAGYGIHGILAPVLTGTLPGPPKPWTMTALPALGLICALSGAYFTLCANWSTKPMFWEVRLDPTTGRLYSYNTKDGTVQCGPQAAYKSAAGKSILKVARFVAQPWKSLFPSLFGKPEPLEITRRMPKNDKNLPLTMLPDHQNLHMMIDMLVRLKGLQLGRFTASPLNPNGSNDNDGADAVKSDGDGGDIFKDEFDHEIDVTEADVDARDELTEVQFCDKIKTHYGIDLQALLEHVEICLLAEQQAANLPQDSAARTKAVQHLRRLKNDIFDKKTQKRTFNWREEQVVCVSKFYEQSQKDIDADASEQKKPLEMLRILKRELPVLRKRLKAEVAFDSNANEEAARRLRKNKGNEEVKAFMDHTFMPFIEATVWTSLGLGLLYFFVK